MEEKYKYLIGKKFIKNDAIDSSEMFEVMNVYSNSNGQGVSLFIITTSKDGNKHEFNSVPDNFLRTHKEMRS